MTEKEKIRLFVDVTPSLKKAIIEAISQDSHSTQTDFLRDAIREKLEKMGYKPKIKFGNTLKTEIEA
jgi:Arc/MetJ-type ribon-helix-helix transcriptional regulator